MRSSLKRQLTPSTPVQKEQHTKLATLWQSLQDHNDSLFFRIPVDFKAFPDYLKYVKQPMDLSTIQRRLKQARYRWVQDMLDDVQMIWDNCRRYNPSGTWIYNISINMERAFRKMVKSYFPNLPLDPHLQQQQKPEEKASQADQEIIFPGEQVPWDQKYALTQRLQLLSPHAIKDLTDCIKKVSPDAFVEQGERAMILVDNITADSFGTIKEKIQDLIAVNRGLSKRVKLQ